MICLIFLAMKLGYEVVDLAMDEDNDDDNADEDIGEQVASRKPVLKTRMILDQFSSQKLLPALNLMKRIKRSPSESTVANFLRDIAGDYNIRIPAKRARSTKAKSSNDDEEFDDVVSATGNKSLHNDLKM